MDYATIIQTPIVALDYLTKGDPTGLTPEQIKTADEWSKDWEITSIEEYVGNETLSFKITESLMDDMEYQEIDDDDNDDDEDDYG